MDVKVLAEHLHDDLVELSFQLGFWSADQQLNRRFFDAVYQLGLQRLWQASRVKIAEERARWMQQLKPSRS